MSTFRFTRIVSILFISVLINFSNAEVNSIHIESQLDPNAIIITQVDIIFVYAQELIDSFPATKTAWYSNQRQFIADAGDRIDIRSVFIPQGFNSETASLPERGAKALKISHLVTIGLNLSVFVISLRPNIIIISTRPAKN